MKKINTHIHIINSLGVFKVPAKIQCNYIYKTENIEEFESVKIEILYNGKKYVGQGKDYIFIDAFADLQKKLPSQATIACCATCKHGSMCPFGNNFREILCTKNIKIKDKYDLIAIYDKFCYDDTFWKERKKLSNSYCKDYDEQIPGYYTYNDYLYLMHKQD